MGKERDIQDAIHILAGNLGADRVWAIDAEVLSVDMGKRTAQVRNIGGSSRNTYTARLMSTVDDGVYFVPEVDSIVCVIGGNFTRPYVSQYSGIDRIILRGGDLGGLVKVITLTEKINNLENLLNDLINKFNLHTHPGVTSGSASTAVTVSIETDTITPTIQDEIENKNVTHG